MKKWLIPITVILFILDFSLKQFVLLHSSEIIHQGSLVNFFIFPKVFFELVYVENTGIAWGMFASFQNIILFLRVAVIIGLSIGLMRSKRMQIMIFPWLLIILGACGNVVDTFLYGYVIDMFHFTFWGRSYGVFNIADAMIFLGAIVMFFSKESTYAAKQ